MMPAITTFLGDSYRALSEVDIPTFSLGLTLGLLLGTIPIPLPGGIDLKLGLAGGPLIVALVNDDDGIRADAVISDAEQVAQVFGFTRSYFQADLATVGDAVVFLRTLLPRKPVDANLLPDGAIGGGHEFMSSSMKLQMQLLHEDDLLGFIADLRSRVRALIVVRQCSVERIARGPAATERGVQPQLKADCELDWITLREKK